jgi:OOP family OmpA-OmpF porin
MKSTLVSVLVAGAFLVSGAQAASTNFYVGVNAGQANFATPAGVAYSSASDTSFGGVAGYNFNEYFGLEAAYTDLGRATATNGTSVKSYVYSLSGVGHLPFGSGFSGVGRLGYAGSHSQSTNGTSGNYSNVTYGIGVQYDFTPEVSVGLNADHYSVGSSAQNWGVNNYSLSAQYHF